VGGEGHTFTVELVHSAAAFARERWLTNHMYPTVKEGHKRAGRDRFVRKSMA